MLFVTFFIIHISYLSSIDWSFYLCIKLLSLFTATMRLCKLLLCYPSEPNFFRIGSAYGCQLFMSRRRKMLESLSFVPNSSALISAHALTERNGSFKKKKEFWYWTDWPFFAITFNPTYGIGAIVFSLSVRHGIRNQKDSNVKHPQMHSLFTLAPLPVFIPVVRPHVAVVVFYTD